MAILSRMFGGGSCRNCGREAYTTRKFEGECEKVGFIKDASTGKFKMRLGALGGIADQVIAERARQETDQQAAYDRIEGQRGYQCTGCGTVYCMNCLYQIAPPHPRGGKACPKCGAIFKHHD